MPKTFEAKPGFAIFCEQVTKRFYYNTHRIRSLREAFIRVIRRRMPAPQEPIFALLPFDMTLRPGEVVALIGPNGSGKSTALRLLAGIYEPSSGRMAIHGRSAAVIELGAGFNNELTGRENIHLYGSLMGLRRSLIRKHYSEILEFADIGHFIDAPVKLYSSGMRARLAFAVTICLKPDILFLDEVLSVGDQKFRERCFTRLEHFLAEGGTLVMATHNLEEVQRFATRVIWFEHGKVAMEGPPELVIREYNAPDLPEPPESPAPPESPEPSTLPGGVGA